MDDMVLNDEEIQIYNCIKDINNLKSFFLFAGAGSGKTHSLVQILQKYKKEQGIYLKQINRKVAIITYTNAACEEIKARLDYDDCFIISTIHSFIWELIKHYQKDIKKWVVDFLNHEIFELEGNIKNIKNTNTKGYLNNIKKLENKKNRLLNIKDVKTFSYEPNGINTGKDYLNHSEVIAMGADFITKKPLLQTILIQKYPILFIDESQDTNKELMDAFFVIQKNNGNKFSLGLFGDIMQRIYFDGKENLGNELPIDWITPEKKYNFRSCSRIIELANCIRNETDKRKQIGIRVETGYANFFIVNTTQSIDKNDIEINIITRMKEITNDPLWGDEQEVKTLILEHHMAASRGGFSNFMLPLYNINKYKTGLLDGSLLEINFLIKIVYNLYFSYKNNDKIAITKIVKKYSTLLSKSTIHKNNFTKENLVRIQNSLNELFKLFDANSTTIKNVIENINKNSIFELPETFRTVLNDNKIDEQDEENYAWKEALNCSLFELVAYSNYILGKSKFGTHQGVKGLEYDRVLAIIDDEESKGFMFKFEKLFGIVSPTKTDIQNEEEGKETSIDRARRLFYVICTRAKNSLAIVAYTKQPNELKKQILSKKWFLENEIIMI